MPLFRRIHWRRLLGRYTETSRTVSLDRTAPCPPVMTHVGSMATVCSIEAVGVQLFDEVEYRQESTLPDGDRWRGWVYVRNEVGRFSLVIRPQLGMNMTVSARKKCHPTASTFDVQQSFVGELVCLHSRDRIIESHG